MIRVRLIASLMFVFFVINSCFSVMSRGEDKQTNLNNVKAVSGSSIKIIFAGDLMALGGQIYTAKSGNSYNFIPIFNNVRNLISGADYAVGNLETTVAGKSFGYTLSGQTGIPVLNAPISYLDAVKSAGFDAVMTANNHCVDKGEKGLLNTLINLNKKNIAHTGSFKSSSDPNRYLIKTIKGIKIGFLSYTRSFNGKEYLLSSSKQGYMLNRLSKSKVAADIKSLKSKGAEFIVVYIHWGEENTNSYDSSQVRDGNIIANAGANVIIGSHPHSLQAVKNIYVNTSGTKKRKVIIAYSLGNFVSSMQRLINKDGALLELTIKRSSKGFIYVKEMKSFPTYTMSSYKGVGYCVVDSSKVVNSETKASVIRVKHVIGF